MAVDPSGALIPDAAPDPSMFDGMALPGVESDALGLDQQSMVSEEGVQVAGPIGKLGADIGSGVARMFGKTLSEARKKSLDPEFKAKRVDKETSLFDAPGEPEVPKPPAKTEAPDPETTGPIFKELSDDVTAAGLPPVAPGTPERFKTADPYDNYIRIGDKDAAAALEPPPLKKDQGLSDFNSKNLPDEASIQERIEFNSQQFAGKINEAKRGKITFEATQQLSDLIGASPKKLTEAMLNRQKGQAIYVEGKGMMETMVAAKNLMIAEMRKLDGLAEIAKTGSDEQAMAFRYQLELVANLQKNFKGSQTEISRSLGAMRIPATGASSDPALAAESAARSKMDLTAMLGDYGGAENVRMMADLYSRTGAPHKKGAFIKGMGKARLVGDALYEVWQHALLTNPVSQTKNILGNILTMFISSAETAGAAAVGTVRRAAGGEGGVTFSDLGAKTFGQTMTFISALKYAGQSFATGKSVIPGSKIDSAQGAGRKHTNAFSGEALGATGAFGTSLDVLGNIATGGRVAFRALEFGDTFFKVLASQGKTWEQAMSAGQARGLKGSDLSDFIADFVNDPPAYAMERSLAEAKYITLQTELDGAGKGFKAIQNIPGMRWMVPFLKTPYNSFKWSFIDRTPLGLFWGDTARMLRAGGRESDEAISRISLGTSMATVATAMTWGGMITGGGAVSSEERATERRMGIQRYSLKVGDEYYSYAGTEPFASIIGIWADVGEIMASGHLGTEEERGELFAAALAGTAYNMTNKSFMQGFATFIEATSDPGRYSKSMMKDLFRSLIPRLSSQIKRINDPIVREARGYIDELKAQIPGLSKDLLPRVDLWGRDAMMGIPEPGGGSNLAFGPDITSPIFISRYDPNPVDLELKRMKVKLRPPTDSFITPGMEEPMQLTDPERYWLQQTAGKTSFKQLSEFIGSHEYKQLKDQSEKGNVFVTELLTNKIRGIHTGAKQMATGLLLQESEFAENIVSRITTILELEAEVKAQQTGQIQ